jgi:hypothetical protein
MPAFVAILLLAPLLAVLIGIYCFAAARTARTPGQRRYDLVVAIVAVLATLVVASLAFQTAPAARGPIWPHVYAALGGFFSMLAVLGLGWWRR